MSTKMLDSPQRKLTVANDQPTDQAAERKLTITRWADGRLTPVDDVVAVEEPLEVRVVFGTASERRSRSLSITMRTPGDDYALAVGFLLSEGLIRTVADVASHEFVGPPPEGHSRGNTLLIELSPGTPFDTAKLQRHFYTTSSCGICGKASLDAIRAQGLTPFAPEAIDQVRLPAEIIAHLPEQLQQRLAVFWQRGGLHAAGLFDLQGQLIDLREDVGRHNAVDKLIGRQLLAGSTPLHQSVLVVSGRASFELVQKALLGGLPVMVAVGAPSSLAIELAAEFGMTIIGFTTTNRFNIYSVPQRVVT